MKCPDVRNQAHEYFHVNRPGAAEESQPRENRRSYRHEQGKCHTKGHRGRTSFEAQNKTYGTEWVRAKQGCWVGTRPDFAGDSHGCRCLTHRSSGADLILPAM